ncbi:penicillin acylase family protein [Streptomyces sp. Ag109_O5-10]|uniref:penicillin acylase family protein n=1 Tax=Streptomyces sp. Ag109_O5-10 TaxID=1855349 RepID=UPI0008988050|nr:penicillin acylase family protein [Streptomyces sp. Ag109_O5-10]SEE93105.1 Penicillin amidase [Streptomyces sp. Ag109_O5-10]
MAAGTYRDAWGIPHLRAADALELARAQGRVTAHDRAWQLEVERHRAQGTSASFLGAPAVAWDAFARRARLADTARRCFGALEGRDPETARWVRAYVAGVNEGLPAGAARTPEFARTGLAPGTWEPWHPLGVWLTTHILFAGFPAKLWREEAIRHLGEEAVPLFATDGPGTSGSNGWLLAGSRTTTGRPLLAGDPHRFIEAPGVYQQIRLACPEFDVVGLAVPGVPGIAHFAHTGTVAWSITNAMADYQDLYRERLRRTDTGVQALAPDGTWTPADRHTETIEVSGNPPVEIEVLETPRGPVITEWPDPPQTTTPAAADCGPPAPAHESRTPPAAPLAAAPTAADGAQPPQGPPAPAHESRTPRAPHADPLAVSHLPAAAVGARPPQGPPAPAHESRTPRAPHADPLAVSHLPAAAVGARPPQGPPAPAHESRTPRTPPAAPLAAAPTAADGAQPPQGPPAPAHESRTPRAPHAEPFAVAHLPAAAVGARPPQGPPAPAHESRTPRAPHADPLAVSHLPAAAVGARPPQGPPAPAHESRTPRAPHADNLAVAQPSAAAVGAQPPQGPPAPDHETCTGGAGGETSAEGEAEALALRYPPRVTEDLGFSALLPLLRARHVTDVDRAFDAWVEPVNVVHAADTDGGVLHRVAGRVPVRSHTNRTRLAPAWLPGHDWQGWHEMPYGGLTDGVAVMANQRGPAAPLGVEFAPPHRADRIRALLDERRTWSADGLQAIHTDTHLASAAPLLDHLAALDGLTPEAGALRDRLLAWDRRMDADSTDAAAYAAVRSAVVRHLAAHPAFAALAEPPALPEVLLPWLALTPRIAFALEHLLRAEELYGVDRPAAVRAAVQEVAAGPPTGTWGDTHRLAPWQALPGPSPYDGPALSGDHDCVLCTSAVPGLTDRSARGPAARYVWDLARREDSRWVVPFGADGAPGAPHHTDQLPLWLGGELAPVVTDWARLHRADLTEDTDG